MSIESGVSQASRRVEAQLASWQEPRRMISVVVEGLGMSGV
jgi:hypothetical protein